MKNISTKVLTLALLTVLILSLSSCATIFSRSKYNVTFTSTPENAEIEVYNKAGKLMYRGQTPVTIPLKSGHCYVKEEYTVKMSKWGYIAQEGKLKTKRNGAYLWNFPNIVLGYFIIDPMTGAMFNFVDKEFYMCLELESRGTY